MANPGENNGPFYIAMVDVGVAYDPNIHHVEDETLDYMKIQHDESNLPVLTIRFLNPLIGPLHSSWKKGIIVSWDTGDDSIGIVCLFVGQLIAIPSDIIENRITYVYHAKHERYEENLRLLADSMRVLGKYDDIFIDFDKRDDPDVVLEGYSGFWHSDRVTNAVEYSDVLDGEDGTITISEDDQPDHTKFKCVPDGRLLPYVICIMNVKWTQTHTGYIDTGSRAFATFGTGEIEKSWPEAGSDIGGGWSVAVSGAKSMNGGSQGAATGMITYNSTFTNKRKRHTNGDTMSHNISRSVPNGAAMLVDHTITHSQSGLVDPFALDDEGKPAPIMIPAEVRATSTYLSGGSEGGGLNSALVVRYDAERERTENLSFQVDADLQPFPTSAGQGETITLNGTDVGEPFVRLETWSNVIGEAVVLGQMIFPSRIGFPGERIAMRATTAGTAGTVLPEFPEDAGNTVADGSVIWTSLGVVNPNSSSEQWDDEIDVETGEIILPYVGGLIPTYSMVVRSGMLGKPQTGTDVAAETIVKAANGSYQYALIGGMTDRIGASSGAFFGDANGFFGNYTYVPLDTNPVEPAFSLTWGVQTIDGTITWVSLGTTLPNGMHQYIAINDGVTGTIPPQFPTTLGATVVDGTVTWVNIGVAEIPMGGSPGNVPNAYFFPTSRGQQAIQYGVNVTRAKLRYRSRMIKISTEIPFIRAVTLSCRKNATIIERRLPGGVATGKIISYFMEVDGQTMNVRAGLTIGCAIGAETVVVPVEGDPVYAAAGYAASGWQQYIGSYIVLPTTEDIVYAPPVPRVVDDGLVFPLTTATGILRQRVVGSAQTQLTAALQQIQATKTAQGSGDNMTRGVAYDPQDGVVSTSSVSGQTLAAEKANQAVQDAIAQMVSDNPYYYELQFPNVQNGPFNQNYSLDMSQVTLPRQIDLEAGP